jgi:hypothetical protein
MLVLMIAALAARNGNEAMVTPMMWSGGDCIGEVLEFGVRRSVLCRCV